jgi:hypothetical protein
VCSNPSEIATGFLEVPVYDDSIRKRGGVMNSESIEPIDPIVVPEISSGFSARDVFWVLGISALSLSLTPVAAFYVLLVA